MIFSLATIVAGLSAYTYIILFPAAVFEGPIVTVIVGFLASKGIVNPYVAYVLIVIADLVGDAIYYAIGRWGRHGFLKKWGKYIGATKEKIEKLEEAFAKYHWKILAVAKLQAIGSVFLISAGVAKAPFWKFIWYNTLGSIPKVLMLELIGFYFGKSYSQVDNYINYVAMLSFVLLIAAYWYVKKKIKATHKELSI